MHYIVIMREVDLRRIDLNLLVALDALLDERSVTRAALRLRMSQPAASRALARLRKLFADALLVEGRDGYSLSARASEIQPKLRRMLAGMSELLEARTFDPVSATGRLRICLADLEAATLVPGLLARLATEAPALDLDIIPPGATLFETIENDEVEAIVGVINDAPAGINRRALYDEGFVTLMRTDHPLAGGKLTLDRYAKAGHIVVSITGQGPTQIDLALARLGRQRRVTTRVSSFLAAMEIAARTDLIVTLPSRLATIAAQTGRFRALPPPLDIGKFTMSLVWHARHQDEPRHIWLRQLIVDAAKPLGRDARISPQ